MDIRASQSSHFYLSGGSNNNTRSRANSNSNTPTTSNLVLTAPQAAAFSGPNPGHSHGSGPGSGSGLGPGSGSGSGSGSGRRGSSGIGSFFSTFGLRSNSNNANNAHAPVTQDLPPPLLSALSDTATTRNASGNLNVASIRSQHNVLTQLPRLNQLNDSRQFQLPISLSLLSNNANSNGQDRDQNDLNIRNNTSTGNESDLRHIVLGNDTANVDQYLQLDLPAGETQIMADDETLKQRKNKHGLYSLRLTPFIDSTSSTSQGLFFEPVVRVAGPGSQLLIGRYTERVRENISHLPEKYHPVVFKSKVVSRTHGCFKVDTQGNWYIKDIKSSSGTFLNHQRLTQASKLSKDILLHDGDLVQLGMDFRGGTEEIYRCVKMRVELNRSWKLKANAFNKETLQKMRNLQRMTTGHEEEDCSICLSKIKPCQPIFISPCAHSWHFRCVRRLVMLSYPQFTCPNCRSACDLEASFDSNSESELDSVMDDDGDELVDDMGMVVEEVKDVEIE